MYFMAQWRTQLLSSVCVPEGKHFPTLGTSFPVDVPEIVLLMKRATAKDLAVPG